MMPFRGAFRHAEKYPVDLTVGKVMSLPITDFKEFPGNDRRQPIGPGKEVKCNINVITSLSWLSI
jgi:hypothetical protein